MRNSFQLNQFIKEIVFVLILFCVSIIYSQEYSVGFKAGGSYSLNDNGSEILRNNVQYSAESDFGYLGGTFLEVNFGKWLVRPEVFFNSARGEFDFSGSPVIYTLDKVSIPLLLGYNIYGNFDIYGGPAYQYILNKSIEDTNDVIDDSHSNLAAQFGLKLSFNRLEIDLRYDFTFPSEDYQRINFNGDSNQAYFDEGRLNQLMLSFNYKLFGSNIESSRRGGNCY